MTTMREESPMSDLHNAQKIAHHDYSYRLPAPPRIVVPPPTLTIDMPDLTMGQGGGDGLDMSFLQDMDLEDIVQKNTLLEWAYERRRQAQMIIPWLYLGPMVAAKDRAFIEREGITMVLAVRAQANSMMGAIQVAREVCIEVATIEVPNSYGLAARLSETSSLINRHIAKVRQHTLQTTGQPKLGKVLVFCESGNEKSAAVVAAYLMEVLNNFDHIKAMQVCQAQRFCINFDDTIKHTLRTHWDILQAKRSIAQFDAQALQQHNAASGHLPSGVSQLAVPTKRPKRSIDHSRDEGDMDMDDGVEELDALRFEGRDVTPFRDP